MWPALGVRVAALAIPSMSCFGAADYRCSSDAECTWDDRSGVCEATQYCSYSDPECPTGRRYSDQAGALADRCVAAPPEDTDEGSSSEAASSTSEADTSSGSASESGATTSVPQPVCGDGRPEGDERCDDGNEVDGDGCNVDCVPSGVPRWDPEAIVFSGAPGADLYLEDVDLRPDESIIAVGREQRTDLDALFVLLTGDGQLMWSRQYDRDVDDRAAAVSAGVGSEIFVVGRSQSTTSQGWIAVIEPATGDVELSEWTVRPFASSVAYMHPSVLVVGGYGDGTLGARQFDEMMLPLAIAESAGTGNIAAVVADGVRDIAWASGTSAGRARVMRLVPGDPEPLVTLLEGPDGSGAQGLAYADGMLVLAGYLDFGMRDGWLQSVAVTGEPGWSWSSRDPSEDEVEDVAIAPTGHVLAAGFTTEFGQDATVWKLGPDGELLWTWVPEDLWGNDDIARGIAVRPDGDLVVVGERTADDGARDGWVIRLTP